MTRILFYDNTINHHFEWFDNPDFLFNYFDIEAQKILGYLGFSFKKNPKLVLPNNQKMNIDSFFDYSCCIKKPVLTETVQNTDYSIGVIFECYV
ncbi:MAG: hypothetical protein E7482_02785 [Ruminococcaceae bacterium]|nr:hypothetical protein [Oscillospiraceae bacterium]